MAAHHKAAHHGVKLVREERETKTASSRKCQSRAQGRWPADILMKIR